MYSVFLPLHIAFKIKSNFELSITLSNVQIIEIGSNEITISMNTRIKWSDYRLKFGVDRALLSEEDQKQVWSPRIVIGTNMMSKSKETEEIEVSMWPLNSSKLYDCLVFSRIINSYLLVAVFEFLVVRMIPIHCCFYFLVTVSLSAVIVNKKNFCPYFSDATLLPALLQKRSEMFM